MTPYGLSRPRERPLPWLAVARAELASKANLATGMHSAVRNLLVRGSSRRQAGVVLTVAVRGMMPPSVYRPDSPTNGLAMFERKAQPGCFRFRFRFRFLRAPFFAFFLFFQVGPIAEEVVFRGCFVPVLLGAGVLRTKIIWLSPLLFGFGKACPVRPTMVVLLGCVLPRAVSLATG